MNVALARVPIRRHFPSARLIACRRLYFLSSHAFVFVRQHCSVLIILVGGRRLEAAGPTFRTHGAHSHTHGCTRARCAANTKKCAAQLAYSVGIGSVAVLLFGIVNSHAALCISFRRIVIIRARLNAAVITHTHTDTHTLFSICRAEDELNRCRSNIVNGFGGFRIRK